MTSYKQKVGSIIQSARLSKGLTQTQLAHALETSQSAINRIEKGHQNVSLEMVARIGKVLSSEIVSFGTPGTLHFRVHGGHSLTGSIEIKTSKNAAVALLCAALLNKGKTILQQVARIEEVNRIIEVLTSIGVKTKWLDNNDLEIIPPKRLKLDQINVAAAKKTRTIIMFMGPLLHQYHHFKIPYAGGCHLGTRTIEPHLAALAHFGLMVETHNNFYDIKTKKHTTDKTIVLTERGDTVTENVLMAAALHPGKTVIRNASPNYMVQDVCLFLKKLGVKIDGIGTTSLTVYGKDELAEDITYAPSEDPIEAMSFLAAAIVTNSEITVKRAPIEFIEIELELLKEMGFLYSLSKEYIARNGHTRLVDITTHVSKLHAAKDKIHPGPFPGLNIDNLPFFALIAATAKGRTLIHDWVYENRSIYLTELTKLNASVELLDPHRVYVDGPTKWQSADLVAPPALRPSVVILLAMIAAPGTSTLRGIYSIARGYEDLAARLNSLGAQIEVFRDV